MLMRPILVSLVLFACVPKADQDSQNASADTAAANGYDLETVEPVVQHLMNEWNTEKPVLFYFFVNQSEEPLMQFFVDLELRDLRRNCKEEGGFHWSFEIEGSGGQKSWFVKPNVRAKRAPTAGRQARAADNVHRTCGPGLVACRWRSA